MPPFVQNLQQTWSRLAGRQRATILGAVAGAALLLGGVAYWASRPDLALLFGGLDAADANRIVESLRDENVPYSLGEGGTAVFVPRAQVYELRLRFAGEGVTSDGPAGYELFDGGTLGMTDFMQKLNYKRALEGELSRTIRSVGGIDQARVHLVLPERSPFRAQQTAPSASVVLRMKGSARLEPAQVEGIGALVAGAVEGMTPGEVTVLDTRGALLSRPDETAGEAGLSTGQLRAQRAVETHLTESGQSMLDRVLGPGRAIVRVSAALDFAKVVEERDEVDPDSAAVLSEETTREQGELDQAQTSIRNFEVSRTKTRREEAAGAVQTLTVSVIVDHKQTAPAQGETPARYRPLSAQEVQTVEDLVRNAVGFDPNRGDRIAVRQTRFDTSLDDQLTADVKQEDQKELIGMGIRYGLLALGLIVAALLVRSAIKRARKGPVEPAEAPLALTEGEGAPATLDRVDSTPALPAGPDGLLSGTPADAALAAAAPRALDAPADPYARKLSDDARAHLAEHPDLHEEARAHALAHPDAAAELVRAWLAEDELVAA